jgi:hypothetical protein
MAMLADSVEVVIGVDTHKQTHTAAVLAAVTSQSNTAGALSAGLGWSTVGVTVLAAARSGR